MSHVVPTSMSEDPSEEKCVNTKNARNILLAIATVYGLVVRNSMESGSTNDWAELINDGFRGSGAEIVVSLCFSLICCGSLFGICFQCFSASSVGDIEKTKDAKQVRLASLCCDCTSFWTAVLGLILIAAANFTYSASELSTRVEAFWLALVALTVKILWNVLIWPTIARKYGNENAQAASELLPICMCVLEV